MCPTNQKNPPSPTSNTELRVNISSPNSVYCLPLIQLLISTSESSTKIPITALNDSGCAASIIKTSTFKKLLPNSDQVTITPHPNTFIVSVTGQETPVVGSTTIFLTFKGTNNVRVWSNSYLVTIW